MVINRIRKVVIRYSRKQIELTEYHKSHTKR